MPLLFLIKRKNLSTCNDAAGKRCFKLGLNYEDEMDEIAALINSSDTCSKKIEVTLAEIMAEKLLQNHLFTLSVHKIQPQHF